jgi:hypothetical protein
VQGVAVVRLHLNDRRVQIGIWLIGLGVVWVGYRAQSTPVIVAGLVLATAGYWSRLGPSTRYRNRVTAIVNDWQRALGAARDAFAADREQRRTQFSELAVPASCAERHRQMLALLDEQRGGQGASIADRSEQGITNQKAVYDELVLLRAAAQSPQEQAYVEHTAQLVSALGDGHMRMTAEFERALSEAISRLESVRVPGRLAQPHQTLSASLRSEYIGLSTYNQAVRGLDLEAAHAAVVQLDRERAVTQAAIAEIYGSGG